MDGKAIKSFLVVKGKVQEHNGVAHNVETNRIYLNQILSEDGLTLENLLCISEDCEALMIDFHETMEVNHIEVELYGTNSSTVLGYIWNVKPCSIKLSEVKYESLKKQLIERISIKD